MEKRQRITRCRPQKVTVASAAHSAPSQPAQEKAVNLSKEERFLRLEYKLFGGPIDEAVRKTREKLKNSPLNQQS